jgi:2EXR family
MEDDEAGQDRFNPKWTEEPHLEDGVYLPLDEDKRSAHPKTIPKHILDIAKATYGRNFKINPPPSPPPAPLAWIPRRHGGGFRFGREEDNECMEVPKEIEPPSLTEFRYFPRLPIELRHMIWRHCLPGPRLVELSYDEDIGACTSHSPLPICLWVCSESRKEAKLFYRLLLATERAEATIYLDPKIDEVYLGIGNFHPGPRSILDLFLSLDPKDVGQIENLAIDCDAANYHEIDEEAPLFGLWWTLALTTTDQYVFTNLRTLTIYRNTSHRSCNDTAYTGFHGDIILTEVESNPGEFQAWKMETSGCLWKRKAKVQPVPWKLPLHDGVTWELPFSLLWMDLENHKHKARDMALKTVRFVSFGQGPDHWAGRLDFLTGKKYVQLTGCIYEANKALNTLLDWREADRDGTGWYGYLTTQLSEPEFDPIHVYLTQNPCDCAIGHVHKAGFYDEDDLDGVDLRKVLVSVTAENNAGRPPWG